MRERVEGFRDTFFNGDYSVSRLKSVTTLAAIENMFRW